MKDKMPSGRGYKTVMKSMPSARPTNSNSKPLPIEGHNKWLRNPAAAKPGMKDSQTGNCK